MVDTVVFHIDAMTGADVRSHVVKRSRDGREMLEGLDVIPGVMLDAFMLQNETRAVVLIDEYRQVSRCPFQVDEKRRTDVTTGLSLPRERRNTIYVRARRAVLVVTFDHERL